MHTGIHGRSPQKSLTTGRRVHVSVLSSRHMEHSKLISSRYAQKAGSDRGHPRCTFSAASSSGVASRRNSLKADTDWVLFINLFISKILLIIYLLFCFSFLYIIALHEASRKAWVRESATDWDAFAQPKDFAINNGVLCIVHRSVADKEAQRAIVES